MTDATDATDATAARDAPPTTFETVVDRFLRGPTGGATPPTLAAAHEEHEQWKMARAMLMEPFYTWADAEVDSRGRTPLHRLPEVHAKDAVVAGMMRVHILLSGMCERLGAARDDKGRTGMEAMESVFPTRSDDELLEALGGDDRGPGGPGGLGWVPDWGF